MTRLTDAELAELERRHEAYMAVCLTKGDCFKEYYPLEQFVLEHYPAILAELRALRKVRKVREAAERYHEASKAYQDLMDGTSNEVKLAMSRQDARIALFAALDEARGEQ